MGTLTTSTVAPFGSPAGALDPTTLATNARGNANVLQTALNTHTTNAGVHLVTTTTAGVSTAATVLAAPDGITLVVVSGTNGSGKTFQDLVTVDPVTPAVHVLATGDTVGSPAARTYTLLSGALQCAMAAGTYTLHAVPIG